MHFYHIIFLYRSKIIIFLMPLYMIVLRGRTAKQQLCSTEAVSSISLTLVLRWNKNNSKPAILPSVNNRL